MTHIRDRRGTAAAWALENPVLTLGELGWERDTRKAKLGDGATAWNDLAYVVAPTPETGYSSGPTATKTFVRETVAGPFVDIGDRTGTVNVGSLVPDALNAVVKMRLTGNVTFEAGSLPVSAAGTQFALVATQDATGGRTLTLTGILKPDGELDLSTSPNSIDVLVFFYDGLSWYASISGKAFAA